MFDYDEYINDLDLSDVCTAVVVDSEAPAGFPDQGFVIPGRPGTFIDPQGQRGSLLLPIRTVIRRTSDTGTVTHEDGEEGHYEENLAAVEREFSRPVAILRRTFPHKGRLRAVGQLKDSFPADDLNVYAWNFLVPSGSWQDDEATEQAAGSVSTGGNQKIHDPILEVGAAGTLVYAALDRTYTVTAAAGPTYPVTIDVGTGEIVDDSAVDARGAVEFSHEEWMVLDPSRTQAITGTAAGSSSVTYRNRWG